MDDDDTLLTKQEVALLLHVSVRTLDRWRQHGIGPPSVALPSGRRRWQREVVMRWLRTPPDQRS